MTPVGASPQTTGSGATLGSGLVTGLAPLSEEQHRWRLRLVSSDKSNLTLIKDTEKEDRYRAIKTTWETQQPGRAARARLARETYLKNPAPPSVYHITSLMANRDRFPTVAQATGSLTTSVSGGLTPPSTTHSALAVVIPPEVLGTASGTTGSQLRLLARIKTSDSANSVLTPLQSIDLQPIDKTSNEKTSAGTKEATVIVTQSTIIPFPFIPAPPTAQPEEPASRPGTAHTAVRPPSAKVGSAKGVRSARSTQD